MRERDIRAIDRVQKRLEEELKLKGFFYERKKNQYEDEEKKKRLDSQLIGQLLFSYYNEQPAEAKNNKRLIFGKEYDSIFNEEINAERILNVWNLYKFIEKKKKLKIDSVNKKHSKDDIKNKELRSLHSYNRYCSLFFLFVIKKVLEIKGKGEFVSRRRLRKPI